MITDKEVFAARDAVDKARQTFEIARAEYNAMHNSCPNYLDNDNQANLVIALDRLVRSQAAFFEALNTSWENAVAVSKQIAYFGLGAWVLVMVKDMTPDETGMIQFKSRESAPNAEWKEALLHVSTETVFSYTDGNGGWANTIHARSYGLKTMEWREFCVQYGEAWGM